MDMFFNENKPSQNTQEIVQIANLTVAVGKWKPNLTKNPDCERKPLHTC